MSVPASAFLPVFNCLSSASTFRPQRQSVNGGYGLVRIRHCPVMVQETRKRKERQGREAKNVRKFIYK